MTCTASVIATSALVGLSLAENKSFATAPLAFQFIAGMLVAVPASLFMKQVGRRIGFLTGTALGIIGAVISSFAGTSRAGTFT